MQKIHHFLCYENESLRGNKMEYDVVFRSHQSKVPENGEIIRPSELLGHSYYPRHTR